MHLGASETEVADYVRQLYIKDLGRDPLATGDAAGLQWWAQTSSDLNLTPAEIESRFVAAAAPEIAWRTADQNNAPLPQASASNVAIWSAADAQVAPPPPVVKTAPPPPPVQTLPPVPLPSPVMQSSLVSSVLPSTPAPAAGINQKVLLFGALALGGIYLMRRKKRGHE